MKVMSWFWFPWISRWMAGGSSSPAAVIAQPDSIHQGRVSVPTGMVLERGRLLTLRGRDIVRIICRDGLVWITDSTNRGDILLRDGEVFWTNRGAVTVVEALENSIIRIAAERGR